MELRDKSILFYDGYCGLCNKVVHWLLKNHINETIYFASLQSSIAQKLLQKQDLNLDTVVFYQAGQIYKKSQAISLLLIYCQTPYPFLGKLLTIVPAFVSNFFYDRVAQVRYKTFGQFDHCPLPPLKYRKQFLIDE